MSKKKVLKITPILVMINILILLSMVCFYSYRLVKYYKLEHKSKSNDKTILVDYLIKKQSYLDVNNGLVFDEKSNTYTYKGNTNENYLLYSGMLFRILSIDENKNIKLVSDTNLTYLYSGLEKGYNDSYINKWLNKTSKENSGIFESNLYLSDNLLTSSTLCSDKIDNIENIVCNEKNNDNKITLLSLYDYKIAGGANSFLNNLSSYYLASLNSENDNYYVKEDGTIGLNKITTRVFGVRPVITINSNTVLIKGNGDIENPYIIEEHSVSKLADAYVGNIISFSGMEYKVVSKNGDNVKVVLNDVVKEKDEKLNLSFDDNSSQYTLNSNIGKYLNDIYYNSLSEKDDIISSDWFINKLSLDNLDYANTYLSKTNCKIGMLSLGDMFVNDINNVFTLLRGIEDDNIIDVINEDGNVYGDLVTNQYNVRPSFYLSGEYPIVGGIGTEYGPYELGDLDEQKE